MSHMRKLPSYTVEPPPDDVSICTENERSRARTQKPSQRARRRETADKPPIASTGTHAHELVDGVVANVCSTKQHKQLEHEEKNAGCNVHDVVGWRHEPVWYELDCHCTRVHRHTTKQVKSIERSSLR